MLLIRFVCAPAGRKPGTKQESVLMNRMDTSPAPQTPQWLAVLKKLVIYAVVPLLLMIFLTGPIIGAVRRNPSSAFLILAAFACAVGLNWLAYFAVNKKCPSQLIVAYGALLLTIVAFIAYTALPGYDERAVILSYIGACLGLAALVLASFWCASSRSRAAHVVAVGIWIVLGLVFVGAGYQVIRDFESNCVSRDTLITLGILIGLAVGLCVPRIVSAFRRAALRRRRTCQTTGQIVQIVGETHLDRDGDPITNRLVRVAYTVNDTAYEIRTTISPFTVWKYGKKALAGRELPVFYDPDNPANAFAERIDRHIMEQKQREV